MGIFNLGKKENKNIQNETNKRVNSYADIKQSDLSYISNSTGIKTDIWIDDNDMVEIEGKKLQKIRVSYDDPNEMGKCTELSGKEYLVDPAILRLHDGRYLNQTKEYYMRLYETQYSLFKGFFNKDDVKSQTTNYIGALETDEYGRYTKRRYIDKEFEKKYETMLKQKQKSLLKDTLSKKTYSHSEVAKNDGYQNMCNELDKKIAGEKNLR